MGSKPEDFHQLKDLKYRDALNRVSRVVATDSADDLVSSTYDQFMYGRILPRQNTVSGC